MKRGTAHVVQRVIAAVGSVLIAAASGQAWTLGDLPSAVDDSFEIDIAEALTAKAYTSPVVVPAAAFSNNGSDADCYFFPFLDGYLTMDAGEAGCFYAPAYIPYDVSIDQLQANVYDNNSVFDVFIGLYQVDIRTGLVESIGTLASTGADTGLHILIDSTITDTEPSQPYYINYFIGACLYDDTRLLQVRVYYSQQDASKN